MNLFVTSRGALTWFCRIISMSLIATLLMTAPPVMGAISSSGADVSSPAPVRTPHHVHVNRTLPRFTAPSTEVSFSDDPTDAEIFEKSHFEEPLVPIGGTTTRADNQALAQALTTFYQRKVRDDFSALENFLTSHPKSPWKVSLLTDLGWLYRHTGWYSKSLTAWQEAWDLGKQILNPSAQGKLIIDRALVEFIVMSARVGRMNVLKDMIPLADKRGLIGSSKEKIEAAKLALFLMENKPETSFRCGPMAVEKIRNMMDHDDLSKWHVLSDTSTQKGTSLLQLKKLADKLKMDYIPAQRQPGSAILVPSVVHWKVGHFAAAVGYENGLVHLQDPTFSGDVWISPQALDAEASGYFLVKNQTLPAGWTSVNDDVAAQVWGKGVNNGVDPNGSAGPTPKADCGCNLGSSPPPPAPPGSPEQSATAPSATMPQSPPNMSYGMARASVYEMAASLCVEDTPLFYHPPVGPEVNFHLTYGQREANQPSVFTYSNLGPLWTFNWLSYITDEPNNPGANVTQYLSGGGTLVYTGATKTGSTYVYQAQPQTGAVLIETVFGTYSSYELDLPDGSKQIFSSINGNGNNLIVRNMFLTQTVDPQGNSLTFTYDIHNRVVAVTDAIGQVTTVAYGLGSDIYKITQVTDPFGRTATFTYTSNGNLQSSTDMLGLVSQFNYTNGVLTSMQTPYGTTTFNLGQNTSGTSSQRWVQITDPQGGIDRVETWNNYNYNVPASDSQCPVGEDNNFLNLRNTFYWDKKAMLTAPGNYNQAQIIHWMHEPGLTVVSDQVESMKMPLESRVYYNYPNQPTSMITGSSGMPNHVCRILDDGSTQQSFYQYNSINRMTQATDPEGRVTNYVYATNGVDLTQVTQQNGSNQEVLFSASYNSQHKPVTVTDAAGQATTYTYNSHGQVLTVTDAKNETTTFSYDSNGYLLSVTGPQAGATVSFTYDGYGRVRTVTDVNGYTLTYDYDSLNRVTAVTYPDGTYDQNTYNNLDVQASKDRQNRWVRYFYNAGDELTAMKDPQGRITNYDRCICGELKGITDPLGHHTSWNQDIQGRLTSKTYADGSQMTYAYENNTSRLKTVTDAKGQVTTYTYNPDDTPSQVAYSNATVSTPSVSFIYDAVYPRITGMTDGTGTTMYTYNPITSTPTLGAGRLASESSPLANSAITYTYDALGRVTATAINGVSSSVAYDSLGRITQATNALGGFSYTYVGVTPRLQSLAYPNGQTANYTYLSTRQDVRLAEIKNLNGTGGVISQNDYTYNAVGTIATWQQQTDSNTPTIWNYQYDNADQLLGAIKSNTSTNAVLAQYVYGYDLAGNRTSVQSGLTVAQTSYNNLNQISGSSGGGPLQFTGTLNKPGTVTVAGQPATMDSTETKFSGTATVSAGTNTVPVVASNLNGNAVTNNFQVVVPGTAAAAPTYDADGNETSDGNGRTFSYDAENRLVTITYSNGTQSVFTYDGRGRRVKIVEQTLGMLYNTINSTKQFVWLGDTMAEERDANDNVMKRFYAQGEQIGGVNYFFSRDHLGSVREMTDSSGNIQARYDYDPYGRVTKAQGTLDSDYQYAGYYEHVSSGLNLTQFRAYDPNTARWLSRDPIGENGGNNLYGYVGNSAINLIDPLGLQAEDAETRDDVVDDEDRPEAFLWDEMVENLTNEPVKSASRDAIDQAWSDEEALVRIRGRGTRRWTDAEKEELLRTGRVKGYQGHHINCVSKFPGLAGDPDNIEFLSRAEHFDSHGGNWQNPTTGPLIPRTEQLNNYISDHPAEALFNALSNL